MKLDFLIFYEHASRELETDCYLASLLKRRGYKVKVINRRYLWRVFLNPRVIVTPYLYGDDDVHEFTGFLNGRKRAIIDLQYEQIYNDARLKADISKPSALSALATHICWGPITKDRLCKFKVNSGRLPITGAISMDFNRPQLRSFLKDKNELAEEFNIDKRKPWHLFISSFVYSSLSSEELQRIKEKIPGYEPFIDVASQSQPIVIDWLKRMAKKHPDIIFIYRPHPNEHGTAIVDELSFYSENIRVISKYSIRQWVTICETSSNWFSTSIADCYFAERPCCVLRPIRIPSEFEIKILEGCRFINEIEEYDRFLKGDREEICPMDLKEFSKFYLTDVSKMFGERVADACVEVVQGDDFPFRRRLKDCFLSLKLDILVALFRLFPFFGRNKDSRFNGLHQVAENTKGNNTLLDQYMERFSVL